MATATTHSTKKITKEEAERRAKEMIASGEPLTNPTFLKYKLGDKLVKRFWGGREGFYAAFNLPVPTSFKNKISEEHFREELERIYKEYGELSERLVGEHADFSVGTLIKRFGSFNDSLRHFGFAVNTKGVAIPRETVDAEVQRLIDTYGNVSRTIVDNYGNMSMSAIMNVYGTMDNLRKSFGIRPSGEQGTWFDYFFRHTGIELEKEVTFDGLVNPETGFPLRFDGYNKDLTLLIEFNDASHFEDFGTGAFQKLQERYTLKKQWAADHGFNFLEVNTTDKPFSKKYMESLLAYLDEIKDHPVQTGFIPPEPTGSKSSPYIGQHFDKKRGKYVADTGNVGYQHGGTLSNDPKFLALHREGFLRTAQHKGTLNKFTDTDLFEYGLSAWEDYESLIERRFYHEAYKAMVDSLRAFGLEVEPVKSGLIISRPFGMQFVQFFNDTHRLHEIREQAAKEKNAGRNYLAVWMDSKNLPLTVSVDSLKKSYDSAKNGSVGTYTTKSSTSKIIDYFDYNVLYSREINYISKMDSVSFGKYIAKRINYIGDPYGKGVHIVYPVDLLRGLRATRDISAYSGHSEKNIRKFIRDFGITSLVDPFAGWGQRMLGASMEDCFYQGNDINRSQVENLKKMQESFGINAYITASDSIEWEPDVPYDGVFTCPPYHDKEIYTRNGIEVLSEEDFTVALVSILSRLGKGIPVAIQMSGMFEPIMQTLGDFEAIPVSGNRDYTSMHSSRNIEYVYVFKAGVTCEGSAYISAKKAIFADVFDAPVKNSRRTRNTSKGLSVNSLKSEILADVQRVYKEHGDIKAKTLREYGKFSVSTVTKYFKLSDLRRMLGGSNTSGNRRWRDFFSNLYGKEVMEDYEVGGVVYDLYVPEYNLLVALTTVNQQEQPGYTLVIVNPDMREAFTKCGVNTALKAVGIDFKPVKNKYTGVYPNGRDKSTYTAVVRMDGQNIAVFNSQDEKRAALYREGYIKAHGLKSGLNGFTEKDLREYGIDSWEEYAALKK